MREELRRLVESPEVRVEDGEGGEDLEAGFARIRHPDVVIFGDERVFDGWVPDVRGPRPAVVVFADAGSDVVGRLRGLDLPGWAVLAPDAEADAVRAALAAAAEGLAVMPVAAANDYDGDAGAGSPAGTSVPTADDEAPLEPLTPREREVLNLMADGDSNKDIAARLGISEHTAKFHVASVLAKLGAANRADAVRRGLRRGLVSI